MDLEVLQNRKPCKTNPASIITALDTSDAQYYMLVTSGGMILCHQKFNPQERDVANILIAHEVVLKTNFGQVFTLPELFIFADEIVAFHPLTEAEYNRLVKTLQA